MIIAKPQTSQPQVNNEYYELFQPAKAIGIDGKEIDIMQSIGHYSLTQLESEKANLLKNITVIEEKITAIESLKAE